MAHNIDTLTKKIVQCIETAHGQNVEKKRKKSRKQLENTSRKQKEVKRRQEKAIGKDKKI